MRDALYGDNPEFLYAFDTLNITSWFPSKPQDDPLKLKAAQISLIRMNYLRETAT